MFISTLLRFEDVDSRKNAAGILFFLLLRRWKGGRVCCAFKFRFAERLARLKKTRWVLNFSFERFARSLRYLLALFEIASLKSAPFFLIILKLFLGGHVSENKLSEQWTGVACSA